MRPINNAADPEFWWRRARQSRAQAEREVEPGPKRAMMLIAQAYERRAVQAEERLSEAAAARESAAAK